MMLSALNDYYQNLVEANLVSTFGYSQEQISYVLVLSKQGKVVSVDDIRDKSGKQPRPRKLSVPHSPKRAGRTPPPRLLWDKTSYALGVTAKRDPNSLKRLPLEHARFKTENLKLLNKSKDAGLVALRLFLQNWTPKQFKSPKFKPIMRDSNVVFKLHGERRYIHEHAAAKKLCLAALSAQEGNQAMCLVTGQYAPIARLHPPVKNVYGAQSPGTSIVAFNLEAFCSYQKTRGDNAPVSEQAAFAYTTALSYMLSEYNRQSIQMSNTSVVFWATAKTNTIADKAQRFFLGLLDPSKYEAQYGYELPQVLAAVAKGQPLKKLIPEFAGVNIFVLGLVPNAARLSIRFWQADTLDHLTAQFAEHFQDLQLQPTTWKNPPSIWRLLYAVVIARYTQPKLNDIPAKLTGELTRAILTGQAYPQNLLTTIIMRMRADGNVSSARVALCKAILARKLRLNRQAIHQDKLPVTLDKDNRNTGYRLGRLFAELEKAQVAAQKGTLNKDTKASIRHRYYGIAAAAPANIFPTLMQNHTQHITKLRRGKVADNRLADIIQVEITAILAALVTPNQFPPYLQIEDQVRFAIGYYHQFNPCLTQPESNASPSQH